jgi:Domain of unknown function (DUF6468)
MILSLASDGLLCALLVAVIFLAIKLDRRLTDMRNGNQDLANLVTSLNTAIDKANTSIVNLRLAARETDETLFQRTATARALTDELSIVVESADRLSASLSRVPIVKSEPRFSEADIREQDNDALKSILRSVRGVR